MLVFLGNVMLFFDCQTFMEYIFILKLLSWLFVFGIKHLSYHGDQWDRV